MVIPVERNRGEMDGRNENFQNGNGNVLYAPSLYLFLYNSLDEGEWS